MQDDGILLYRRFLDGDQGGLEELISLYQHALLRFIYGYVHDTGVAEDIFQEVFVEIYCRRSFKERDGVAFKTYLYTIARNKCLNAIKKRNRKRELSLDALMEKNATLGESAFEEPSSIGYGQRPDDTLEQSERDKALRLAISQLKQEYREVLILRYFEDLPPERIAQVTKRKIKQVYNLLARGKSALKDELLAQGVGYEDD